jgi:hypothetical protein
LEATCEKTLIPLDPNYLLMALLISINFPESGPRTSTVNGIELYWLTCCATFLLDENNDSKHPINAQHIFVVLYKIIPDE